MAIIAHEVYDDSLYFNCVKSSNGDLHTLDESIIGSFFRPIPSKDIIDTLVAQLEGAKIPAFFENAPVVNINEVTFNTTGFPKVCKEQFVALVKLFNYFAKDMGNLEVGCIILHHETHGIRFVVPYQTVTPGSVGWDTSQVKLVSDLVTGVTRSILDWYEEGWNSLGCAHSHNTMKLSTPSSTDDTRELPWSGWYLLLSSFEWFPNQVLPNFVITTTITVNKKRYTAQPEWCLESPIITEEDWNSFDFSPTVLTFVNRSFARTSFSGFTYQGHATQKTYGVSWQTSPNFVQRESLVRQLIDGVMRAAKRNAISPATVEEMLVSAFFEHFPQYSLDFFNDSLDEEPSKEPLLITGTSDADDPFFFSDY